MEHEGTDRTNTPGDYSSAAQGEPGTFGVNDAVTANGEFEAPVPKRREPTILTLQDLIDLPRQILPEETFIHLQNACREASLAAFSLWRSIEKSRRGDKVRTRIDVE